MHSFSKFLTAAAVIVAGSSLAPNATTAPSFPLSLSAVACGDFEPVPCPGAYQNPHTLTLNADGSGIWDYNGTQLPIDWTYGGGTFGYVFTGYDLPSVSANKLNNKPCVVGNWDSYYPGYGYYSLPYGACVNR